MSDAKSAGWSPLQRWPARLHWRWQASAIGSVAVAAAALAVAPLLSLVVLAFGDTGDLWAHLARYVIPPALVQTALLLAGVAALTIVVGTGTAWTVTTFTFPGRDALTWLLPLPLAIPTYIVAYVYVDILDALGPVQSTLRAIFGWRSAADYRFPNIRSLGGAILLFSFVLYPYVYLAARAMFQTQGRLFSEAARMLGAQPWELARRITFPLARPAIAVGTALALLETLNDIGASEYLGVQTLTLSIFTTWLNRGSLAGSGADGLPPAGDRCGVDRARTPRTATPGFCRAGHRRPVGVTDHARGGGAMGRCRRLLPAGRARLPAACGLSSARGSRTWAARRFRHQSRPLYTDNGGARLDRNRDHAGDGFLGGRGAAIHEASGHRRLREHRRHRLRRAGNGACAGPAFTARSGGQCPRCFESGDSPAKGSASC